MKFGQPQDGQPQDRQPQDGQPQAEEPQSARAGRGAGPGLLAVLTAVGPISTDMYLPAFTVMRADLHGGAAAAPLTLAAWFGGLAVGQLIYGPFSDHFGRRTPMLLGCLLYAVASAACALSTSMPELIAFRALAAFGGAANLVIPLAIVRDIAKTGQLAADLISRQQLILAVIPMLAPTLGGLIVEFAGWRTIFWVAVVYGVACVALILTSFGETLPRSARGHGGLLTIMADYLRVGRDRYFFTHALTGSFATFSLFAFLGGAPAVFMHHFSISPTLFGATFIANGAGYALGTAFNSRLIRLYGRWRVLRRACHVLVGLSGLILVCMAAEIGGVWVMAVLFAAVMLTLGCLLPDAAIGAVGPYQRDAGVASALYGTLVFAIGALGSVGVGLVPDYEPVLMGSLMLLGAVMAVGSNVIGRRSAA